MTLTFPAVDPIPLLPILVLTVAAIAVLVADLFLEDPEPDALVWPTILAFALLGLVSAALWGTKGSTLGGVILLDDYALFVNGIVAVASLLTVLLSADYLQTTSIRGGEYYSLVLFAAVGMVTMAAAGELIVLFVGLELMSIAVYVLAGMWREEVRSNEAALKYFLLGAFAAGFLLFGIALLYATTGSTNLDEISAALPDAAIETPELLYIGIALLLVGFGFKVAAAPFHVWTPDVYEGAPTSVTALMAVGVKAAAFAAFGRVFLVGLEGVAHEWHGALWGLAVLTMTVGNLLAITQSNVKRLLAYSSIAHAGYLLVPLVVGGPDGGASLLFYLAAYAIMNLGAFGVVCALAKVGEPNEAIDDYAGLGFRRPFLAIAMATFMLSLAGVPPLVGFFGKFYVFSAAVSEGYVGLAVIGVLNSVVSAYYYIWLIVTMYMREGGVDVPALGRRPYLAVTIGASLAATIVIGLFPSAVLALARAGFLSLG